MKEHPIRVRAHVLDLTVNEWMVVMGRIWLANVGFAIVGAILALVLWGIIKAM